MADEKLDDSLQVAPLTLVLVKEWYCQRSLDPRIPTDDNHL